MYISFGWLRYSSKVDALGRRRVWVALDCPFLSEVKYWFIA